MSTYVASNPGDIVIIFRTSPETGTEGNEDTVNGAQTSAGATPGVEIIPVSTLEINETQEVEAKYGVGFHKPIAKVQGKQDFKGNFAIDTWWAGDGSGPSTWDNLIKNHLQYPTDQNLSREFDIEVQARAATGENGLPNGNNAGIILTVKRALIEGNDTSVPNGSGTLTRKYNFSAYNVERP
jgi:hypothetical protein